MFIIIYIVAMLLLFVYFVSRDIDNFISSSVLETLKNRNHFNFEQQNENINSNLKKREKQLLDVDEMMNNPKESSNIYEWTQV
jgi:hypothetical protein